MQSCAQDFKKLGLLRLKVPSQGRSEACVALFRCQMVTSEASAPSSHRKVAMVLQDNMLKVNENSTLTDLQRTVHAVAAPGPHSSLNVY